MSKTLTNYHNKMMKSFDTIENKLPKLQNQLDNVISKINNYENREFKLMTDNEINQFFKLKNKKEKLENEINSIKNKKNNYFINTFDCLTKYYNDNNKENTQKNKNKIINNVFYSINNNNDNNFNSNNKDIYEKYLEKIDDKYISEIKYVDDIYNCDKCNGKNYLIKNVGLYVCNKCGNCKKTIIENDKIVHKCNIVDNHVYCYKRIIYFSMWLNQFKNEICNDDYNKIKEFIFNNNFDTMFNEGNKEISVNEIKYTLKQLNIEEKYKKKITTLFNRLNGYPELIIDKTLEEKLIYMFNIIQEPFEKHKPKNRKNFLSYTYCIRKFLELLNVKRSLIKKFELLKGIEKLTIQDKIWEKICRELKWEYIESV